VSCGRSRAATSGACGDCCCGSHYNFVAFSIAVVRARTGEGRERAKARGVRFGRPKKLTAHQRREAIARINAGEAVADVARTFGVNRATVYRLKA
jgi:DNA invertase Pin-like site-specific DNA recombinase